MLAALVLRVHGRDRTGGLALFRRTLIPTELRGLGAPDTIRTCNRLLTRKQLSQLSYRGLGLRLRLELSHPRYDGGALPDELTKRASGENRTHDRLLTKKVPYHWATKAWAAAGI